MICLPGGPEPEWGLKLGIARPGKCGGSRTGRVTTRSLNAPSPPLVKKRKLCRPIIVMCSGHVDQIERRGGCTIRLCIPTSDAIKACMTMMACHPKIWTVAFVDISESSIIGWEFLFSCFVTSAHGWRNRESIIGAYCEMHWKRRNRTFRDEFNTEFSWIGKRRSGQC